MKKILFVGFILAILVLISGCAGPKPTSTGTTPTGPSGSTVDIKNSAFDPIKIIVSRGTTVTWTNRDNIEHTVTGNDFDSGLVPQDKSFSYIFKNAGNFEYHCVIHPSMQGRVIVT